MISDDVGSSANVTEKGNVGSSANVTEKGKILSIAYFIVLHFI